jgi:3-dehydroquinate dehydratase I
MVQKVKICAVVTGSTIENLISNLKKAQALSSFVEIRADYIKGLKLSDIEKIRKLIKVKSIFTCRKKKFGGLFSGSVDNYIKIIKKADTLKFNFLDINVEAANRFKQFNSDIIISYHNFERTPDYNVLSEIKTQMNSFKHEIKKFALMIKTESDLYTIYKLLLNKEKNKKMIVIGMGEKGKISRIITPFFGSYLTFASIDKKLNSASGQMTIGEMTTIFNNLYN